MEYIYARPLINLYYPYLGTLTNDKLLLISKYSIDNNKYDIEIYNELAKRNMPYANEYISKLVLNTLEDKK